MNTNEIINKIEPFLTQTPLFFITNQYIIDGNLIKYLSKYRRDAVSKIIVTKETGEAFVVEIECSDCHQVMEGRLSKTKLLEYIFPPVRSGRCYRCLQCEDIKKVRQKQEYDFRNQREVEQNLESWKKILDPDCAWNEETSKWERWKLVSRVPISFEEKITETIKRMSYSDFLRTPYWEAVRSRVLQRDRYKCKVCGKGGKLNVHHSDYSIHGSEHNNLDSLITLCQTCHGHFSSKLKVANQY